MNQKKQITVSLPQNMRTRLKVHCARTDQTMVSVLQQAIDNYLRAFEPANGGAPQLAQ